MERGIGSDHPAVVRLLPGRGRSRLAHRPPCVEVMESDIGASNELPGVDVDDVLPWDEGCRRGDVLDAGWLRLSLRSPLVSIPLDCKTPLVPGNVHILLLQDFCGFNSVGEPAGKVTKDLDHQ